MESLLVLLDETQSFSNGSLFSIIPDFVAEVENDCLNFLVSGSLSAIRVGTGPRGVEREGSWVHGNQVPRATFPELRKKQFWIFSYVFETEIRM
jgi:hypothetical protein